MRVLLALFVLVILALGVGLILRLVHPLPPVEPRPVSTHVTDTADSRLGRQAAPLLAAHPGLNGVHLLNDGQDALAARIALARAAGRSLDVQYYIWKPDISGNLLARELLDAADRGVRVRLLLDDNGTAGVDAQLAAMDAHPNIEVRLWNPFTLRRPKAIGYLMDFPRLNRRMHNKSFTADSQASVVGGRNVGDEYFGATEESLFEDLDAFVIGPAVADVSAMFDRYWAAPSAYRAASILGAGDPAELQRLRAGVERAAREPLAERYALAIESSLVARDPLPDGAALPLTWAPVTLLADDPAKGLGRAPPSALLAARLAAAVGEPQQRLSLVSAYFVPTSEGTDWFAALAERGRDVSILTNAFESTDVAAVHAGYAKHRRRLLEAGVTLWELKAEPGRERRPGLRLGSGSGPAIVASGTSLHAKTFAVDGARLFIGSFNFDPRSVEFNTEMGFLIDSAELAATLDRQMDGQVAMRAYRVRLADDGALSWEERTATGSVSHRVEPGTRWFQRALVRLLGWLPIDWLL